MDPNAYGNYLIRTCEGIVALIERMVKDRVPLTPSQLDEIEKLAYRLAGFVDTARKG
jgi:hypothetical protein